MNWITTIKDYFRLDRYTNLWAAIPVGMFNYLLFVGLIIFAYYFIR